MGERLLGEQDKGQIQTQQALKPLPQLYFDQTNDLKFCETDAYPWFALEANT